MIGGEKLPYYSLKLWHGFTPALYMSIVAVAGGAVLLMLHKPLARMWDNAPRPEAKVIFEALIAALTDVDTDRLPEEKARGITIDLGFAPLDLEGIGRLSVVDVPGHEGLVRTMVSGATGIDLLLLVVAADESVMPQTREHVAICDLLGIERAVVALTKSDLVDEELIELASEEVRDLLERGPSRNELGGHVHSLDRFALPRRLDSKHAMRPGLVDQLQVDLLHLGPVVGAIVTQDPRRFGGQASGFRPTATWSISESFSPA